MLAANRAMGLFPTDLPPQSTRPPVNVLRATLHPDGLAAARPGKGAAPAAARPRVDLAGSPAMTHDETSRPGRRRGRAGRTGESGPGKNGKTGKNGTPWPRRPLLTALWIPAAAVLLPLGGALGAFGAWFFVPALALAVTGVIGLIYALMCLCQTKALQTVALLLAIAPVIAVPMMSMNTVQAAVLSVRGTAHPGTVTDVTVIHGKGTSYSCAVRYDDAPGRTRSVACGSGDAAGERVSVTEDPGGLVDPAFTSEAENPRFDLALVGLADVSLLAVTAATAGLGALLQLARRRRYPVAPTAG
ncbi:hypothetical protein ACFV1W_30025 [Kitasatospora sp. NPDC059648]|uniref:hypothetical protein n=1 Tax=Kitasatospora sp. NPDC059648 TaxID=3346894 RepID=UPI0036D0B1E1